jgi:hypothetical protein
MYFDLISVNKITITTGKQNQYIDKCFLFVLGTMRKAQTNEKDRPIYTYKVAFCVYVFLNFNKDLE